MIKVVKNRIITGIKNWDTFWFKPLDTLSLSCFRICFCLLLLCMYLIRFIDFQMFYYESGLLSSAAAKSIHFLYSDKVLHFIPPVDAWLYPCYILFIIFLVLMILGNSNRFLALGAFILHLVFLQRNPTIAYGADMIATFWLFYLIFANSGIGLKSMIFRGKVQTVERKIKGDWLNTVAFRFIQIQLCVIYIYSGLEKLRGQTWWEGTALWEALSFYDYTSMDFSFLLGFPIISSLIVISTLLFEIYFPVLVWIPKLRTPLLIAGACFHIGISFCLIIPFFSLIILSSYILFIPPSSLRQFLQKLKLVKS